MDTVVLKRTEPEAATETEHPGRRQQSICSGSLERA